MSEEKPFKLHRAQGYIAEVGSRIGVASELKFHDVETTTCDEKAKLLYETGHGSWSAERVVKALYFHPEGRSDHYIGIVTPETHSKVNFSGIIEQISSLKSLVAQNNYVPSFHPKGMMKGTCTPFPYDFLIDEIDRVGSIEAILICDFPNLEDQLVDVSVGGTTHAAKKVSLHLPYGGIFKILNTRFPGKANLVEPKYGAKIEQRPDSEDHFYV